MRTFLLLLLLPSLVLAQGAPTTSSGSGSGTVTSVLGTAPIVSDGNTATPTLSCTAATTATAGCLSAGAQNIDGAKTFLSLGTFSAGLATTTLTASGTITSSVASGSNAVKLLAGARLDFNSGTDTVYMHAAGGTLTVVGSRLALPAGDALSMPTGANFYMDNSFSKTLSYSATKGFTFTGQPIALDYTDGGGTTGNQTINKASFRAAFAAASASITITNSMVLAATSPVICTLERADTTCASVYSTPAAGSVVLTTNAACTATTKVSCVVTNN